MRTHSVYVLTCPCGRGHEMRNEIGFTCSCGRVLEIAWSKPLTEWPDHPTTRLPEPEARTRVAEAPH
jgi:hypothetical protein